MAADRSTFLPPRDCPWVAREYNLDDKCKGLHQEIEDFVEWVSQTPEEDRMRQDIITRIKELVAKIFPHATVKIYGSYETDLCIPYSDVDIVIFGATKDETERTSSLFTLYNEIERSGMTSFIQIITHTKVPIIKFVDSKSGSRVDVTLDCESGAENTKMIKRYLAEYPLLRPITLVIKYYLAQRYLNETWSGGIGSYTLVIMIISYLQLHTKNKGKVVSDNENLAHLLTGFFHYYGNQFDYITNAISILEGGRYFPKASRDWLNQNAPGLLSIEDPHNPTIDMGCASYQIERAKEAFSEAYHTLNNLDLYNTDVSIIGKLVSVESNLANFRDRIKRLYGHTGGKKQKKRTTQQRFSRRNNREQRAIVMGDFFPTLGSVPQKTK
eukprot:TRINITY_DN11812_c0_g1_i1.p1 TRINITY_DN11812_c0_g1~~TRINITY_DN11812_c0_g1_i1.p1  ORF type:complete len:393 (-),score=62.35 TRINITY_DN11812_c0_g1_i1:106-1257(-)